MVASSLYTQTPEDSTLTVDVSGVCLGCMDKLDYSDLDAEIIDVSPKRRRKGGRIKWFVLAAVLLLIVLASSVSIYIEALWFGSLGFSSRFWYVFGVGWALFVLFGTLTFTIIRGGFYVLESLFGPEAFKPRQIIVNKQPVDVNIGRFLRPISWILAIIFGIGYGVDLSSDWNAWVLYLHQPAIVATDPIFGNSLGFYLFTLPIYGNLASWLTALSLILLVAAVVYAALSAVSSQPPTIAEKEKAFSGFSLRAYAAVSVALGLVLIIIAWQTALSRYEYLWIDHSSFSGVTYTEANYLLPGLTIVAISLVIAAIILFITIFTSVILWAPWVGSMCPCQTVRTIFGWSFFLRLFILILLILLSSDFKTVKLVSKIIYQEKNHRMS